MPPANYPSQELRRLEPPSADDTLWFKEEVLSHDSQLRGFLRSAFPSVRDVDDVVQESYLRVWKRQAARPIVSVKAFLFQVARHLALDVIRNKRRTPINQVENLAGLPAVADSPSGAEAACTREEVDLLLTALAGLPGRTREVYLLRKFENLSQKEVAARLGISEHTVEVHIGRANRRCERFLRRRGVISGSEP